MDPLVIDDHTPLADVGARAVPPLQRILDGKATLDTLRPDEQQWVAAVLLYVARKMQMGMSP